MRVLQGWFVGCLALGLASCSSDPEPQACTTIGCVGGAYVSVLTHELEDGDYTLRVSLDDSNHTCTLSAPDDLPETGGHRLQCDTELKDAVIAARVSCDFDACEPLDGFELSFRSDGFPNTIAVALELDGVPLMNAERPLEYQRFFPNGAGCDSGCRAGEAKFQVE